MKRESYRQTTGTCLNRRRQSVTFGSHYNRKHSRPVMTSPIPAGAALCNTSGYCDRARVKERHSTDMAVYTFKEIVDHYLRNRSPVFVCFLDARKAFDRVNHWTLFSKLFMDCKRCLIFVQGMRTAMISCFIPRSLFAWPSFLTSLNAWSCRILF